MVVAENMCLEVQKLRKVLGVQTTEDALGGADFTVMKALAVINQCASSDTTPSDLERCRSVLADAEDVLTEPSRRSDLDLVTSLGLVDVAEISEIRQAIERGLAASKEAQLEERERRLTKGEEGRREGGEERGRMKREVLRNIKRGCDVD